MHNYIRNDPDLLSITLNRIPDMNMAERLTAIRELVAKVSKRTTSKKIREDMDNIGTALDVLIESLTERLAAFDHAAEGFSGDDLLYLYRVFVDGQYGETAAEDLTFGTSYYSKVARDFTRRFKRDSADLLLHRAHLGEKK